MYQKFFRLFFLGLLVFSCARVRVKDAEDALSQARAAQTRAEDLHVEEANPESAKIARTILEEAEVQKKEGADPRTVATLAERARSLYEQLISEAKKEPPAVDVAKERD